MKMIKVYGSGCQKCRQVEEAISRVVAETGADARVVKVDDLREMIAAGIMVTPAVAVDGTVKMSGRIPKEEEIKNWLK